MIQKIIMPLVTMVTIYCLSTSCAKQGTPSGGPKDTIPPNLLVSVPSHQTVNFKGTDIYLEFDEKINADKLKQQLLITPISDIKYSHSVKKNILRIKLETPLKDSTTYTFNFSDGVVDITEKNPAVNLKLAISTGSFIDSLQIIGQIKYLQTNKPAPEFIVALYDVLDSTNVFDDKPKYFATTNDNGQYILENIKNGRYRIYSWKDENRSLTYQPKTEPFGFISDTLLLNHNLDSIDIPVLKIDNSPLQMTVAKPFGKYFDIRYSKHVHNYNLRTTDNRLSIPSSNIVRDNEYVRIYNDIQLKKSDSIPLIIQAFDSIGNNVTDTIYAKFNESKKQPEQLQIHQSPKANSKIQKNLTLTYKFNKPIKKFNAESIIIKLDTIISIKPVVDSIQWNNNMTRLELSIPLDWQYINDTITNYNLYLKQLDSINNTLKIDSLNLPDESSNKQTNKTVPATNTYQIKNNNFNLVTAKSSFISIENDSSTLIKTKYQQLIADDFGSIKVNIKTSFTNFIVQLISKKNENLSVIAQFSNKKQHTFKNVPPGKYSFRIINDLNANQRWDYGNYIKNVPPEPAYFPKTETDLKANWEVNLDLTF